MLLKSTQICLRLHRKGLEESTSSSYALLFLGRGGKCDKDYLSFPYKQELASSVGLGSACRGAGVASSCLRNWIIQPGYKLQPLKDGREDNLDETVSMMMSHMTKIIQVFLFSWPTW